MNSENEIRNDEAKQVLDYWRMCYSPGEFQAGIRKRIANRTAAEQTLRSTTAKTETSAIPPAADTSETETYRQALNTICSDEDCDPAQVAHEALAPFGHWAVHNRTAPAQSSTDTFRTAPSSEGVGQGEIARSAAPSRLCTYDGKPCPPRVEGRGSGNCKCEQNGICQRTSLEALPKIAITSPAASETSHPKPDGFSKEVMMYQTRLNELTLRLASEIKLKDAAIDGNIILVDEYVSVCVHSDRQAEKIIKLEAKYADLERSILDGSHPNIANEFARSRSLVNAATVATEKLEAAEAKLRAVREIYEGIGNKNIAAQVDPYVFRILSQMYEAAK